MHETSLAFIELGAAFIGLAILARVASRWGFSVIPLYLIAGLCFGKGGFAPMSVSSGFIGIGANIGVLLLLFMLGLEYTGEELRSSLSKGFSAGLVDFFLNFTPGVIAGLMLQWSPLVSVLLGGVTWVSSSGVIAKILTELKWLNNSETPTVVSILVFEDLSMALYLPLMAALLLGGTMEQTVQSVFVAVATVGIVLTFAIKFGHKLSALLSHESDEVILLTTLGMILLIAGEAERLHVSAAIGAFLIGLALSGPIARHSQRIFTPLRDLFAASFFFFFGLEVDPQLLPPVLPVAAVLSVVTILSKLATGYLAAGKDALPARARIRAGVSLVARGEFSIVIAGLGSVLQPQMGPICAAYVLILAIVAPILARGMSLLPNTVPEVSV